MKQLERDKRKPTLTNAQIQLRYFDSQEMVRE